MKKSIIKIFIPVVLIIALAVYLIVVCYTKKDIEIDINKLIFPVALLIVECIIFFSIKNYRHREKKKCNYNREVNNVVEPGIAEYIINSKIDNKNMIMSILLDLNTRGNVQFESDNRIRLLNYDNVKDYERRLLNSFFRESKDITFSELNDMFIVSNKKTSQLFRDIKEIKYLIKDKTYNLKIYDIKRRLILDFIQLILVMIVAYLAITAVINDELTITFIIILASIYFLYMKYSNDTVVDIANATLYGRKSIIYTGAMIGFMVLPIMAILIDFWGNLDTIIYIIDVLILGVMLQPNILTKKGKEEYLKLLGLKKYIEDYSLMDERKNQDVELWEKYLVYATAFGVPNKVLATFKNGYLNTNITLQALSNFFSLNND